MFPTNQWWFVTRSDHIQSHLRSCKEVRNACEFSKFEEKYKDLGVPIKHIPGKNWWEARCVGITFSLAIEEVHENTCEAVCDNGSSKYHVNLDRSQMAACALNLLGFQPAEKAPGEEVTIGEQSHGAKRGIKRVQHGSDLQMKAVGRDPGDIRNVVFGVAKYSNANAPTERNFSKITRMPRPLGRVPTRQ